MAIRKDKVKLYIEHPDGYHETIIVTTPLAITITQRLLKPRYPFMSVVINDVRLKEQGHASNVFNGYSGEQVIL